LQISQVALQVTADAVSAGVVIANAPEGNIVLANPEAKRVFRNGIRPGQVIADYGQWAAANIDGQPLKPEEYPLAPAILRGEATDALEVLCNREDGTPARVTLSARPINGQDGRRIGAIMIVQAHDAEMRQRQSDLSLP
jgi:PAS domain-containing protein